MTRHSPQVVLVGGGHAHLHLLAEGDRFRRAGLDLAIIDPGRFWYSGLATGMLGGMYAPDEDVVDPRPLAERCGARFVAGRAIGLDRARRVVHGDTGETLPYDVLSFNVGSEARPETIAGAAEYGWTVKPIQNLCQLRMRLAEQWRTRPRRPQSLIVIGGGPTGCEIAANLLGLARRCGGRVRLTLLSRSPRLAGQLPGGASARLAARLRQLGARIEIEASAAGVAADHVVLEDGRALASDATIIATGLRPPELITELGLPIGDTGGLRVRETLQCDDDPRIFGVGDCIDYPGRRLPKLGVFGVRAAPILLHNLIAAATGASLRRYRPQKRWLSILNLGDATALATWGPLWWSGRSMMRFKHRLDTRWLRQYRLRT